MAETHFVQGGDEPVLIGSGTGTLVCSCGNMLIQVFDPVRFLATGIQCARCAVIATTLPLAEGDLPPRSAIIAAPSVEPRPTAMTVPADVSVVGDPHAVRFGYGFPGD